MFAEEEDAGVPDFDSDDSDDDIQVAGRQSGSAGRKRLSAPRSCTTKRQAIVDDSDDDAGMEGKDDESDDSSEGTPPADVPPAAQATVPSWPAHLQRLRSTGSGSLSRAASGVTPRAASGHAAGESSDSALSWGSARKRGSAALRSSPLGAPERRRAAKKLRVDFEARAQEHGMTLDEAEQIAAEQRAAFAEGDEVADVKCVVRMMTWLCAQALPACIAGVEKARLRSCCALYSTLRLAASPPVVAQPAMHIQDGDSHPHHLMQVCGSLEDEESMLMCDWCQQGCHMGCHDPPMTEFPADDQDYFCPHHTRIAEKHEAACKLRVDMRRAQRSAGITEDDMVDLVAAQLNGEVVDAEPEDAVTPAPAATAAGSADSIRDAHGAEAGPSTSKAAAAQHAGGSEDGAAAGPSTSKAAAAQPAVCFSRERLCRAVTTISSHAGWRMLVACWLCFPAVRLRMIFCGHSIL